MANYETNLFKDKAGNTYDFSDPEARETAEEALAIAQGAARAGNGYGSTVSNYVPLGANLATKFAGEIGSTKPITWFKQRVQAHDFEGMDIFDYLPLTLNDGSNTLMNMQIGDFSTYYGVGDTVNGDMVTLVPDRVYPLNVKFNDTATNNGNSAETSPWLASDLYQWLNTTFYGWLPTEWKNALKDIRVYNQIRYASEGNLTNDNGGKWMNLGKVWVPSEIEVWGAVRRGTSLNEPIGIACTDKQFEIFAKGPVIRSRAAWWERCAAAGSSSNVCYVGNGGHSYAGTAAYDGIRPLPCFHIG